MEILQEPNEEPSKLNPRHLLSMLNGPLSVPRNHEWDKFSANQPNKENVAMYIWKKLGLACTFICAQKFQPQEATALKMPRHIMEADGSNLIGVFPGSNWGTSQDELIIVIAHWDTVRDSPGFDDNGSGVAALLEVARAIGDSKCSLDNSIILAAVDLEEVGTHGAAAFVHEFLIGELLIPFNYSSVKGAIVLDSVMSYNSSEGSQIVSEAYLTSFPETSREIIKEKSKGDFIGLISRRYDSELVNLFKHHWSTQEDPEGKFGLRKFEVAKAINATIPDSTATLEKNSAFLRSDHVRFWLANHENYYSSFKAIHVTDTGPARGEMKHCYHQECDTASVNATKKFTSLELLQKVTQTTIDLLLDVSNAKCSFRSKEVSKFKSKQNLNYYFFDKTSNSTIKPIIMEEEKPELLKSITNMNNRGHKPYIYYMYNPVYYLIAPLGYFVNYYD